MINDIFTNKDLNSDFESDVIELIKHNFLSDKIENFSISLAVIWQSLIGNLDSKIEIFVSNDAENWCLAESLLLDSETNSDDINIYLIDPYLKFIKLKYTQNNTINGILSASIVYSGGQNAY